MVGWLGFYCRSNFVGYLRPNPFLFKLSVLFQMIQFSMITQFNCQKHFFFKLFSLFKQLYISTLSMSKTVQFQTIQFCISTQFECTYSLLVKNISISSYSVQSSSSNSANSVQDMYRFCLYTVKCQNSSMLNDSVQCKCSFNVKNSSIPNTSVQHKHTV